MTAPTPVGALLADLRLHNGWHKQAERWPRVRVGGRELSESRRRLVLMRDGHRCVWCGAEGELQVDHIVPWSAGGSDDSTNLRTLCAACNQQRSNRRDVAPERPALPVATGCTRCSPADDSERSRPGFCAICRTHGAVFA